MHTKREVSNFKPPEKRIKSNLLARVAFPPDRCNADLRCGLHSVPIRDASSVEHGLSVSVSVPDTGITANILLDKPELRDSHGRV